MLLFFQKELAVDPKSRVNYTGLTYFSIRICDNVSCKGRDTACYSNRSCYRITYIYSSEYELIFNKQYFIPTEDIIAMLPKIHVKITKNVILPLSLSHYHSHYQGAAQKLTLSRSTAIFHFFFTLSPL